MYTNDAKSPSLPLICMSWLEIPSYLSLNPDMSQADLLLPDSSKYAIFPIFPQRDAEVRPSDKCQIYCWSKPRWRMCLVVVTVNSHDCLNSQGELPPTSTTCLHRLGEQRIYIFWSQVTWKAWGRGWLLMLSFFSQIDRSCKSSPFHRKEWWGWERAEGCFSGGFSIWKCESMRKQVPPTYPVIVIDSAQVHKPRINSVLNSSFVPDLPKSSSVLFILRQRLNSSFSLHLENYRSLTRNPQFPVSYPCNPLSALFIIWNHIPV